MTNPKTKSAIEQILHDRAMIDIVLGCSVWCTPEIEDALYENMLKKQTSAEVRLILASTNSFKVTQAVDDEKRNEVLIRSGIIRNNEGQSNDKSLIVKRVI